MVDSMWPIHLPRLSAHCAIFSVFTAVARDYGLSRGLRCTRTQGDPRGPRAASLSTARAFARFCCPGQRSGRAGPRMTESRHGGRAQLFCAVSRYQSYDTDPYGWFTAKFALNRSSYESRRPIPSPRACSRNAILGGETCTRARESVGAQSALLGELYRWVGSVTRVWTSHCG